MINTGFTINGITWRALEAQVMQNKLDIAEHRQITQVLADWGIKVIGQLDSPDELPPTYSGPFGDAYAVGPEAPYDYYIWTRADINSGHPEPYWLMVGPLSIVGPQGPQGDKGERGEKGEATEWYFVVNGPYEATGKDGDFAINKDGNFYQKEAGAWKLLGSLKGPQGVQGQQGPQGQQGIQGPQGIPGPQGEPGNAVTIVDLLSSTSLLPDPDTVSRNSAYLVTVGGVYHIYIITGTDNLMWKDVGLFGAGTLVTDSLGTPFETVNIDEYVKKPTSAPQDTILVTNAFVPGDNYSQTTLAVSSTPAPSALAQYDTVGNLATGYPVDSNDCVNTQYLDLKFYAKAPSTFRGAGEVPYYFQNPTAGTTHLTYARLTDDATGGAIPKRNSNGDIPLPDDQTLSSSNRAISMRTALNGFTRTLYRHNKTLEIHASSFDLVIKWEELKPTYTADNFSNVAGQVPSSAIIPGRYLICSGFALDGTYTTLVTSFKLSGSSLQLNGVSASANLFGAEARTFSRPLTINLNDYSGTAGAIKVTDELSNI